MLCILSGSQPFFRSPDDCTALAEITTIFGSKEVQKCAQKLGILTRIVIMTNDLFIEVLISFVSLIYVNFLLYLFIFFLFHSGKKVIFSENLPGMDIISLCLRLKQRNKTMMYDTQSNIYKVYLVYILNIFLRSNIAGERRYNH